MQTIRNELESVHRDAEVQSEPLTSNRYHQAKRRDPNNPQWLAKQTCWRCGKVGHIHPKCTALQAEREAYYAKKVAEQNAANVTTGKLEVYAKAMFAKGINDGSEEWADIMVAEAIISGPEADTEVVIDKALVEPQAHAAKGGGMEPKPWIVNSGCSTHFSPNWSEFIEYTPFPSPHQICLGDSRVTPSMGEGTVSLTCLINGKPLTCLVHSVQYIPALAYTLLSCRALTCHGLMVTFEGGSCKIHHEDRTLIAASSEMPIAMLHLPLFPHSILHTSVWPTLEKMHSNL